MKKLLTITVLGLMMGLASVSYSATLVDVPDGHWAADAVQKLVDLGLIKGYQDGTFKGDRELTRYEYAMVVERMADMLDNTYCLKEECKGSEGFEISAEQLAEIKDIVEKLKAEFMAELEALNVKVDGNTEKISALEEKIDNAFLAKLSVEGSIRQRIDVPGTDFTDAYFASFYNMHYNVNGVGATGLGAGYEIQPTLIFNGEAGQDVTFSLGLQQIISNEPDTIPMTAGEDNDLDIIHAYVDVDFTEDVRELDVLTLRSGYQKVWFGPYGMLVDNTGVISNAGLKLNIGKDIVGLTAFGALVGATGVGNVPSGIGSISKDAYTAVRLDLDLNYVDLGVNYLASGMGEEKGWGADIVAPLLKDSPFLKELRAEYMTITDMVSGAAVGSGVDDNSFVVGLDLYQSRRAGVTLSYADLPAAPVLTGMDANPFTEYDQVCPLGLDVADNVAATSRCYTFESGRMLFPAGFEGLGVEASYIVLQDVTLAAKAIVGNYAGGTHPITNADLNGEEFPGFGAFSVTKPINDKSQFRVEYMQQGLDPIMLSRVRGELLINF